MGKGGDNNKPSSRSTNKVSHKTKRPSFFKILIGNFINQLRIPRAFLNHFNGKLPEVSILKSPTGSYWNVKMKKVEKNLFFHDGWEKFVKEHSLEFGDFLVFRYSGKCKFKVKIYAKNACEKEIVPHVLSEKINVESNSHKKKHEVDVAVEKCAKDPYFNGQGDGVEGEKQKTMSIKTTTGEAVKQKRIHVKEIERKAVLDQYNSEFSCFTAACSHFKNNHMTIPKKVVEENGLMNKASMQLSDPHGRLWPVTLTYRVDGRMDLRGLGEFWKGNNIEAGDTCGLKFSKDLGNVVYMEIFRAKKLVEPIGKCLKPSLKLTCTPNEDAIPATESREESDSVEIVNVSPICPKPDLTKDVIEESEATSNMRPRLTPLSRLRYSLRSFKRSITSPTFDSHSRCTTQVMSSPKRDRNPTKNTEAFSPCQMTESTEFDEYDSAIQEESSDCVPISKYSYSAMTLRRWPTVTTLMTRVAKDFKSDNPFYVLIVQPSYVNKPFKSNVPSNFARKYFKQDLCLTLRRSDGRSWPVQCVSVNSNAKLYGGWRNFAKENHLKEGDVCVFELVNRHNIEMEVFIYRAGS